MGKKWRVEGKKEEIGRGKWWEVNKGEKKDEGVTKRGWSEESDGKEKTFIRQGEEREEEEKDERVEDRGTTLNKSVKVEREVEEVEEGGRKGGKWMNEWMNEWGREGGRGEGEMWV